MQQFKMYDGLKIQTDRMAKNIAKKHNFVRKIYLIGIILGCIIGMYISITELTPIASHLFFAGFLGLSCLVVECF